MKRANIAFVRMEAEIPASTGLWQLRPSPDQTRQECHTFVCHRVLPPTWQPCQKRRLLKPLFHISGEVFIPAQGSHIDLHMLAMFFHDRQIEQNLVERIRTVHIDDSHHTPRAHTFPEGR